MNTKTMLTTASTIALLSAIAPIQAFAEDAAPAAETEMVAPAAGNSSAWGGFHAGFGLRALTVTNALTKSDGKALTNMVVQGSDPSVQAGYDVQSGNFVFGVNANYDFGSSSNEFQKSTKTTITETIGAGWGAGIRAGMLANESTLVFGSAGYTSRKVDFDSVKVDGSNVTENNFSTDVKGRYVGIGFETKLSATTSLTGEYRFNNFDGFTVKDGEKAGKDYISDGVDAQEFRISMNWRF